MATVAQTTFSSTIHNAENIRFRNLRPPRIALGSFHPPSLSLRFAPRAILVRNDRITGHRGNRFREKLERIFVGVQTVSIAGYNEIRLISVIGGRHAAAGRIHVNRPAQFFLYYASFSRTRVLSRFARTVHSRPSGNTVAPFDVLLASDTRHCESRPIAPDRRSLRRYDNEDFDGGCSFSMRHFSAISNETRSCSLLLEDQWEIL